MTDDMLLREAEWWVDMADLETLTDAQLVTKARVLIPELRRRLDACVVYLERHRTNSVLAGGSPHDFIGF